MRRPFISVSEGGQDVPQASLMEPPFSHTGGPDQDNLSREEVFCKDQHSKSKHTKCLPSRQKVFVQGHAFKTIEQGQT